MESIEDIREVLKRFYQGETTLEEEKMLSDYFASTTVPEEFIPDKELFQSMGTGSDSIEVPASLNQKIITSIEKADRKEIRTRRISLFSLSGLAAGLLVMIAVYLFFLKDKSSGILASNLIEDTYEDPMDAYEEAKRTLVYVSSKLNRGTGELKHVKQVKRSADPLQSLSKINKGSKELRLLGQLQKARNIKRP